MSTAHVARHTLQRLQAGELAAREAGPIRSHLEGWHSQVHVGELTSLERIHIAYDTAAVPQEVRIHVEALDGERLVLTSRKSQQGAGSLDFQVRSNLVDISPALEDWPITTRWQPDGRGRAGIHVVKGDGAGESAQECWDAMGLLRYRAHSWSGFSAGDASSCILTR
jgi:hypothetical protein